MILVFSFVSFGLENVSQSPRPVGAKAKPSDEVLNLPSAPIKSANSSAPSPSIQSSLTRAPLASERVITVSVRKESYRATSSNPASRAFSFRIAFRNRTAMAVIESEKSTLSVSTGHHLSPKYTPLDTAAYRKTARNSARPAPHPVAIAKPPRESRAKAPLRLSV